MRAGTIRNRALARGTAGFAALAMAISLAGCGTSTSTSARQWSGDQSGQSTMQSAPTGKLVMIIRHGEKPKKKNGAPGIDAQGKVDDHSLTPVGWQRARALADVFDGQGPAPQGLVKPATIYAAGSRPEGEGARTRETVMPLAEKLGVPVNAAFGKGEEEALAQSVAREPGPTLISWQHSEIPSIAEAFGVVNPAPPSDWPDDRYDVVWRLEKTPAGWQFAQIPQMVLPGDQAVAIAE